MNYKIYSAESTQENKYTKARHRYKTRRLDILDYMLKRPHGTSVMELVKGVGLSLASIERYLAKLKADGDIELLRAEPIKGVSKRPVKYYVVSAQGELDGLLKKSY